MRLTPLTVSSGMSATGDNVKACTYYRSLLDLTAPPFPTVEFDGLPPASCPQYARDRRTALKAAIAFVSSKCT